MNCNLHDFHLLRPAWLLALPLGLLLLSWRRQRQRTASAWQQVCDPHLLDHLLVRHGEAETARLPVVGQILMLLLVVFALSGPTCQRRPQPLYHSGGGRVLVLDLSRSMDSPDLAPSRLIRARYRAIDLIRAGKGREQGVVIFAGDAFIVAPLTDDSKTLLNLLPGLDTDTPPVPGSRADRGLEEAGRLLARAGIRHGQIILLADDADARTIATAQKLNAAGHRVEVIAVGTRKGAPIPLPGGGYLKDKNGRIVVPVPNFAALEKTAAAGGGRYLTLTAPESAFAALNRELDCKTGGQRASEALGDQWLDLGPWLLLPLLPLAAASFRRGWLLLITLFLTTALPAPRPALAFSWSDLWLRPDQRAARALRQKEYDTAARLASNPEWRAAALYRAGKYQAAADLLAGIDTANAHYNRGNALARAGKLREALQEYDRALNRDPALADAQANRELVRKLLEQLKQQAQKKDSRKQPQRKPGRQTPKQPERQKKGKNAAAQAGNENRDAAGRQAPAQKQGKTQPSGPQNQGESGKKFQSDRAAADRRKENRKQSRNPAGTRDGKEPPEMSAAPPRAATPGRNPEEKKNADKTARQAVATRRRKSQPQSDRQPSMAAGADDTTDRTPPNIEQQALKQWLRRIPDDPGGLLRRKFLYQYQRRRQRSTDDRSW